MTEDQQGFEFSSGDSESCTEMIFYVGIALISIMALCLCLIIGLIGICGYYFYMNKQLQVRQHDHNQFV